VGVHLRFATAYVVADLLFLIFTKEVKLERRRKSNLEDVHHDRKEHGIGLFEYHGSAIRRLHKDGEEIKDYKLTRFACDMVAMNRDVKNLRWRKPSCPLICRDDSSVQSRAIHEINAHINVGVVFS
jgi:hypothetical protein